MFVSFLPPQQPRRSRGSNTQCCSALHGPDLVKGGERGGEGGGANKQCHGSVLDWSDLVKVLRNRGGLNQVLDHTRGAPYK